MSLLLDRPDLLDASRLTSFFPFSGSQNGFDNSGVKNTEGPRWGSSKSNVDRSLEALGVLTQFVTDEKYLGVVKAYVQFPSTPPRSTELTLPLIRNRSIEVLNEPLMDRTGKWGATWEELSSYYVKGEHFYSSLLLSSSNSCSNTSSFQLMRLFDPTRPSSMACP